jgi:ATP phosphoribosyltransferase
MKSLFKLAIQKSGRLSEQSLELFKKVGIKLLPTKSKFLVIDQSWSIEIILVRDDDIPELVSQGVCDAAIVGENVLQEYQLETNNNNLVIEQSVEFGQCRLSISIPNDIANYTTDWLEGKRLATSYPLILEKFLKSRNVEANILKMKGSVEIAPKLGFADAIFDIVSSGATLIENDLKEVESILKSQAVLISQYNLDEEKQTILNKLKKRLQGVIAAKNSKYIMLHSPKESIDQVQNLLGGLESPTIVPLTGMESKVALHAVISENIFWEKIESLKEMGCSSILVLPIEKMSA